MLATDLTARDVDPTRRRFLMKKLGAVLIGCYVLASVMGWVGVDRAQARPTYFKAFLEKYVGDEKSDSEKALAKEIKRVKKCNVCHDPRKGESGKASKKNRNLFGQELSKLLSKDDQKDKEKALKMLAKVESKKAPDSEETFGQLIKAGKLPFEYKEEK